MLNSKTWIIISIIITLLLGFTLGLVVNRATYIPHMRRQTKEISQERLMARLSRKMDLSRPQIQAIGGILRLQAVKIKKAKDEFRMKLKEIGEETVEKIKPHLTPEQQEKYAKLVSAHKRRWERLCQKEKL